MASLFSSAATIFASSSFKYGDLSIFTLFFFFFSFLFFSFLFRIQYEVPSRGTANQLYLKELDRIVLKAQTTLRSFANSGTVRKTVSLIYKYIYLFICILILLFLFYFNIYIYYIKQKLQLIKDCCIPSTCNYRVFVFSNRQECHLHLC